MRMKDLMKCILEDQIRILEGMITMMIDDLDNLVAELENLIEVSDPEQDLEDKLEEELTELIQEYCVSANFGIIDNMTIAAVIVEDYPMPYFGVAKCNPTDEFNVTVGRIIALKRALGLYVDASEYGEPTVIKDCDTCKYDEGTSIFLSPYLECLKSLDGEPICWESWEV